MKWPQLRDRWVRELRHGNHETTKGREKWFFEKAGWKRFDSIGVFWDLIERLTHKKLFVRRKNSQKTYDYWVPTEVKERISTNLFGKEGCYDMMHLFELLEYETDWKYARFVKKEPVNPKYPYTELASLIESWEISDEDTSLGFMKLFDDMVKGEFMAIQHLKYMDQRISETDSAIEEYKNKKKKKKSLDKRKK